MPKTPPGCPRGLCFLPGPSHTHSGPAGRGTRGGARRCSRGPRAWPWCRRRGPAATRRRWRSARTPRWDVWGANSLAQGGRKMMLQRSPPELASQSSHLGEKRCRQQHVTRPARPAPDPVIRLRHITRCRWRRCCSGADLDEASAGQVLGEPPLSDLVGCLGGSFLKDVDYGGRPRPARSFGEQDVAPKRPPMAFGRCSVLSAPLLASAPSFEVPTRRDPPHGVGISHKVAPWTKSEPKGRNIVLIRALSPILRGNIRQIELRAGRGRAP